MSDWVLDLETAKFLFQVLSFLLTGCIGIYVFLTNKNRATNERLNKLEDDMGNRLDGMGERLAVLEARIEGAIKHNDLEKMHEKINSFAQDMNLLRGEFSRARDLLDTIHNHMLGEK